MRPARLQLARLQLARPHKRRSPRPDARTTHGRDGNGARETSWRREGGHGRGQRTWQGQARRMTPAAAVNVYTRAAFGWYSLRVLSTGVLVMLYNADLRDRLLPGRMGYGAVPVAVHQYVVSMWLIVVCTISYCCNCRHLHFSSLLCYAHRPHTLSSVMACPASETVVRVCARRARRSK